MAGGFKRKSNNKADDFIDDGDESEPPSKRGKATGSEFQPSTEPKTDGDGNKYWEISKARRVTISEFKGKSIVNIREYYQQDGKWLPGKKVLAP
jgi:Transcriptional Coactivator p15 (PC4)